VESIIDDIGYLTMFEFTHQRNQNDSQRLHHQLDSIHFEAVHAAYFRNYRHTRAVLYNQRHSSQQPSIGQLPRMDIELVIIVETDFHEIYLIQCPSLWDTSYIEATGFLKHALLLLYDLF
jgi:hypothetical protein